MTRRLTVQKLIVSAVAAMVACPAAFCQSLPPAFDAISAPPGAKSPSDFGSSGNVSTFNPATFGFSGSGLSNSNSSTFATGGSGFNFGGGTQNGGLVFGGTLFNASLRNSPAVITPVDQNQLYGQSLANLVNGPPTLDASAGMNDQLLPMMGLDASDNTDQQFNELAADLYNSAGQPFPATPHPVAVLTMGSNTPSSLHSIGDRVTLSVKYDPSTSGGAPNLVYFDTASNAYVPVQPAAGSSMQIDAAAGTIDIELDHTSVPALPTLFSSVWKPILVADLPRELQPSSEYIAFASDSTPSLLRSEVQHSAVFVLAHKSTGFYYSSEPSVLSRNTLGAADAVTICDTGALISQNEGGTKLLNGRALMMAGKRDIELQTPGATVQAPSDASVLVEYNKMGSHSRISLVGAKQDASAMVNTPVGKPIFLSPGRSISIYQDLPVFKRLKLVAPSGQDLSMTAVVKKSESFDARAMLQGEGTEAFSESVGRRAQAPLSDPDRVLRGKRGFTFNSPVRMLSSDKTILSVDKNQVSLLLGNVFVHTSGSPTILKTDVCELRARAQADLALSYKNDAERVDVLSGPGLVSFNVSGTAFDLVPGQELVISRKPLNQAVLTPPDGIARRRFKADQVGDVKVSTCDFEIASMLKNAVHLKSLRRPNNPIDGSLRERLLKTACAVHFATSGRGKYFVP